MWGVGGVSQEASSLFWGKRFLIVLELPCRLGGPSVNPGNVPWTSPPVGLSVHATTPSFLHRFQKQPRSSCVRGKPSTEMAVFFQVRVVSFPEACYVGWARWPMSPRFTQLSLSNAGITCALPCLAFHVGSGAGTPVKSRDSSHYQLSRPQSPVHLCSGDVWIGGALM